MKSKIELIYTSTEGHAGFNINGRYYEYRIDSGYLPQLLKLRSRRPGRALNLCKRKGKLIKGGKRDESLS